MIKIIEVKETIFDSKLVDNIYAVNNTINNIINQTDFITELNRDDYNYMNIIMEKIKINLDKVAKLLKQ